MTEVKVGRLSEAVCITVSRAKKLHGTKGDTVISFAKLEFDGKSLGDSAKVESTAETDAEYNFTTSFECSFSDGHYTLQDVASKPVLVTIIEVLPKEKKQKEEKTVQLGQCTVDLLPLFHSDQPLKYTLELYSATAPPPEPNIEVPKTEIEVTVSINEPLIEPGQHLHSNLLTVRVGSAYSVPDAWSSSGSQFNYIVGLPVPVSAEKDVSVIFSNGQLKPASDKEQIKRSIKWHSVPNAIAQAQYIPNSACERIPADEEKGDFRGKEFIDFRRDCESEKNRITWDVEKRCYLQSEAKALFQNRIADTRLWPVEIMRTVPSQPKEKGSKKDKASPDEEGMISFHGVAYVDLAPLLYPGVCSVAGAFRVYGFNEAELAEKTKQKNFISEDVVRIQSCTSRVTGSSPVQKGKGGGGGAQKDQALSVPSKKGSALKQNESNIDLADSHSLEAAAYLDNKTFLYLDFSLSHPLVPRREAEELAKNVSDYIPPRPAMKRVVGGAAKAVDDYHSQLSSVAVMVLDEFRQVCGDDLNEDINKQGDMKKQLMYQLNSTGKYFAFKEQLKHSIVKIVREKYMKTTSFKTNAELQQFLTELYVFLIDEMHSNLQKVFSVGSPTSETIEPIVDSTQLKRFAQEAEVNEDYEMASKYYQERLARDDGDAEHWLDYGTFNLHVGNSNKAKECFKQTVAIQQNHLEGLLLYGIMASMDEQYSEAETMFERAVSVSQEGTSNARLSWTVLALFYDSQGNEIRAEHAFIEANKHNLLEVMKKIAAEKQAAQEAHPVSDRESDTEVEEQPVEPAHVPPGVKPHSAKSVSTIKGTKTASRKGEPSTHRARSSAENSSASADHKPIPETHSSESTQPLVPPSSIFLQSATWLLDHKALKFAEIALSKELVSPNNGTTTAEYFVTLSRLQLMRKQYQNAVDSLSQATTLDHENPDGWAMLGHVNYVSNNFSVALDCYERTLAFVSDATEMHSIYLRLASIYLQEEQFLKAKNTFLLACKHSPTCISWLGVGTACFRLDEISEAENALAEANILNNTNADVWAYLSLVCLKTGRKLEAEQAYKYALKLGLKDENLFQEIGIMQKEMGFGNPSL